MISALTCLLFPFVGDCPAFVRDKPKIAQVQQHKAAFTGKTISVTGRVRDLDQWKSASEGDEELFFVCDDGCIHVYLRVHSPIQNGQRVTVVGQYFRALRIGRRTFENELEAVQVLPRE